MNWIGLNTVPMTLRTGCNNRVVISRDTSISETMANPASRYPAPDSLTNSALIKSLRSQARGF